MDTIRDSTPTYQGALNILSSALTFGIEPSLEGVRALTAIMGDPQRSFVSLQVAGTNGKSSTARLLAAFLRTHGFKVGLYTSPELICYPERFEIDGSVISDERFAEAIYTARRAADDAEQEGIITTITEFELLTAAALWLFAQQGVDFAVLEVGLGGRWDATSVVDPAVATITGVDFDHTAILGSTLEEIASEKAAIIKPACAPILGPGTQNVLPVFLDRAEACQTHARLVRAVGEGVASASDQEGGTDAEYTAAVAPQLETRFEVLSTSTPTTVRLTIYGTHGVYEDLHLVAPHYQAQNIATALAAAEAALGHALESAAIQRALDMLVIPGRFEILTEEPLLLIDAAHNPQSTRYLAAALVQRFGVACTDSGGQVSSGKLEGKPVLLLGILRGKDVSGIVEALAPLFDRVVVTQSPSPRSIPADELAGIVRSMQGVQGEDVAGVGVQDEDVQDEDVQDEGVAGESRRCEAMRTDEKDRSFSHIDVMPSFSEALRALRSDGEGIVATGSITLAGAVKQLWLEDLS